MRTSIPHCLGIPVEHKPDLRAISESRGIWPWKKIVVGADFFLFPEREKQAILLHEAGHCKMFHLEKRLARLWLLVWPARLAAYCKQQEFQADFFAAECGYGADLARAFSRMRVHSPSPLHPAIAERLARLAQPSR